MSMLTSVRVNVGGKLDVICFDKTGTLTEDGLDVLGIRIMTRHQRFGFVAQFLYPMADSSRLSELLSDISCKPESVSALAQGFDNYDIIIRIMATCHSLRVVDDELLGDPLDVKMFQFTGWSFQEGGGLTPEHQNSENETIVPSVARPPNATVPMNSGDNDIVNVSNYPLVCFTVNVVKRGN